MATNPVAAGFVPADPDANVWLDEIDEALTSYQHFLRMIREVPENEMQAVVRHSMFMSSVQHLAELGVTVTGGVGHA